MDVADIEPVVARAVRDLAEHTGLPVSFGGPVARDGRSFVLTSLSGTLTRSLRGLRVGTHLGLGGKALALGKPVTVNDYPNARGITHSYDWAVAPEGLFGVLATPIKTGDQVAAVLYLATRSGDYFGDRTLDLAAPVLRRCEREIVVETEVRRRLAGMTDQRPAVSGETREIFDELATITDSVADPELRAKLRALCCRASNLDGPAPCADNPLTPRERDVLSYVAIGCSNVDIAERLGLLPNTVKSYVKQAIRKLGARNRTHAAHLARTNHFL
ncbi:LuxR family transcriptional regulator [Pseudonocardiaceae bacterium YIM PH 21723]|nr:LuxR family transcriptional regulator [Pseudonocardiaceae bacterium YIM PH 21723]